jgi:hypothetical protein
MMSIALQQFYRMLLYMQVRIGAFYAQDPEPLSLLCSKRLLFDALRRTD